MTDLLQGVGLRDGVEILILAVVFYRIMLLLQGTRAMQMLLGLALVFLGAILAYKLGMHTITWIFSNFLAIMVTAVIVLFQPELRRSLATLGRTPLLRTFYSTSRAQVQEELARTALFLAGKRIGALLVVQRETELGNYIEGGELLDARLSRELLTAIFLPNSPLHDGAALIKDDRVQQAGAFLPISLDPSLDRQLGTRHRAAIGVTQETDAVVVVVSEETGTISLAVDGQLERNLDGTTLRMELARHLGARRAG